MRLIESIKATFLTVFTKEMATGAVPSTDTIDA